MDLDEDLWNIIENVRRAESAKDLCKALKACLGVLESKNTNKRKFIKYLNEYLLTIGGSHRLEALYGDHEGAGKSRLLSFAVRVPGEG